MTPKTGFNKEGWTQLLPETYNWLNQVKFEKSNTLPKTGCLVITTSATDEDKDSGGSFECDAPALSDVDKKSFVDAALTLGWRGAAGSILVQAGGRTALLVASPKLKTTSEQKARAVGLEAARATKDARFENITIVKAKDLDDLEIFDGYSMGLYTMVSFKGKKADTKQPSTKLPQTITLVGSNASDKDITDRRELCRSVAFTRMLQDAPANWLDPVRFGEIAEDLSKQLGVTCKVVGKEQIIAMGMGSFWGVAQGSDIEPRLITIEIPGVDNSRTVALVGKGLTFDAGGISLKPGAGMEEMKYDMSGGAAVLGSAHFLARVKPPTKVVCIIGATENMPSGKATKPGDIHVAMNGKTIEIQNTDAEGRLVLADLLHYAATQYNPEMMIDIATLTGAVLIALGTVGAGAMGNDQATTDHVLKSAASGGEPLWQLPMWPELEKEVKGEVADFNNIAKPSVKAGTIMGAMFLKEFVGDRKWVHLDVAGTAWNCKATGYPSAGGCAYGLRTMTQACLRFNR